MRTILFYLLLIIGIPVILGTLVSILPWENYQLVKIMDFPRIQFLILSLILLSLLWIILKQVKIVSVLFLAGLIISAGIQIWYLYPYSPLAKKKVPAVSPGEVPEIASFGLFIVNVRMHNRRSAKLLNMIDKMNPDLILLMETDGWWEDRLQGLDRQYPHGMEHPLNNGYGMLLYSRFPLSHEEVRFLNYESVPSFHTQVELPGGNRFQFHGVHPVPPISEKAESARGKEKALQKVGTMIDSLSLPAVVAGDLNDVAWTRNDHLFQQGGRILDVRMGRGIINTFDATNPVIRWPLDYLFVTEPFGVSEFRRLEAFGSDHFPLYARLHLLRNSGW